MIPEQPIRIGTRDSPLAMWQAEKVQTLLKKEGIATVLVPVKSEGDLDLVTPLYAMGVQGVFTKALDAYLLSGYIDIAVHSMKDVPVQLAQGLVQAAVLTRGVHHDVIVWKDEIPDEAYLRDHSCIIGTGSIRRSSQWLFRYPHHRTENLRGNIQTRLKKLKESNWTGAIFAAAGLKRMHITGYPVSRIDFMLPAPAQGTIMVVCRESDTALIEKAALINDMNTALCVYEERSFLSRLQGGCSAPIAALTRMDADGISFSGRVNSLEGSEEFNITRKQNGLQPGIGRAAADELLSSGIDQLITEMRKKGN